MVSLFKHPIGSISNRINATTTSVSFIHSDRSLFFGVALVLLVIGYLSNLINIVGAMINSPKENISIFSLAIATASVIVFSGFLLRNFVLSKKFTITNEKLYFFNHWPLSFSKNEIEISDIQDISIITFFSHLSKKCSIHLSIRCNNNKRFSQIYTCLRQDLNDLVIRLETSIRGKGIVVFVDNENTK